MLLIVFDNGGTLIDDPFPETLAHLRNQWTTDEVLAEYFGDVSFSQFLTLWKTENAIVDFPLAGHFLQEERWIAGALLKLPPEALDVSAIPIVSPRILSLYRSYVRDVVSRQSPLAELRPAISDLKADSSICLAVASNDRQYATRAMLKWAALENLFDFIFTSEGLSDVERIIEKPNPEFFRRMEEDISRKMPSVSFGRKIYVGDNERNDVEVPNTLGYLTLRYFNSKHSPTTRWLDTSATTSAAASYRKPSELLAALNTLIRD
jgi:FMN phosphatase YigB (HAD superfamily)